MIIEKEEDIGANVKVFKGRTEGNPAIRINLYSSEGIDVANFTLDTEAAQTLALFLDYGFKPEDPIHAETINRIFGTNIKHTLTIEVEKIELPFSGFIISLKLESVVPSAQNISAAFGIRFRLGLSNAKKLRDFLNFT